MHVDNDHNKRKRMNCQNAPIRVFSAVSLTFVSIGKMIYVFLGSVDAPPHPMSAELEQ
ncbi:MAG TPA: hypothetical protein VJP79_02395 [Nitrososphaera sp.]|nr:hypothetical protein [Nitrososphaera sp.]